MATRTLNKLDPRTALAHTIGNKAEAAYRRGDLFNKRRGLMDAWASYCGENAGKVVRLAAGSARACSAEGGC